MGQLACRYAEDAEVDAETRVADAADATEAAAAEAKTLRESNDELMGFMQELEQASIEVGLYSC
jgi:hypothetical protein